MVVAEQLGDGPFNRGALLNAAFLEARSRGAKYVALHDVDALPLPRVNYSMPDVGGPACALSPICEICITICRHPPPATCQLFAYHRIT